MDRGAAGGAVVHPPGYGGQVAPLYHRSGRSGRRILKNLSSWSRSCIVPWTTVASMFPRPRSRRFSFPALTTISLGFCRKGHRIFWNVILGERGVLPGQKHQIKQFGIAGHLLLVTCGDGLDLEVREQLLHIPVGGLGALDASGRTNVLNRGNASQGRQAIRLRISGAIWMVSD